MSYTGPFPIDVSDGGTGRSTLTANSVLVGSGTTPLTPLAVGSNGQLLIGATSASPAFATITSSASTLTYTTGANTLNIDVTAPLAIGYGGTNATSMATTDGTVYYNGTSLVTTATGTSGQILTSAGAGNPPAFTSAGSMVYLGTQTASNSASLTFTTGISSKYNDYMLLITALLPATGNNTIIVQINSGSGYLSSGYLSGLDRIAYNNTVLANATSTAGFVIGGSLINAGSGLCGVTYLYNMTSAGFVNSTSTASMYQNGSLTMGFGAGIYNTDITVSSFQVLAITGNLTSGTVSLYGIRES